MQLLIPLCPENPAENLNPLICRSKQQLQKVSLCNHSNLGKLVPVNSQQGIYGTVYLPFSGNYPIRTRKRCAAGLFGNAAPPFGRAEIFRIAQDDIALVPVGKFQFHIGFCLRLCIFRTHHAAAPGIAAWLPEQGKGNGVKNRCLSGTGVSGDQIEAMCSQPVKIQDGLSGIWAKGRHCELNRSHASSSSQTSCIICRRNASCSGSIGW